MATAPYPRQRSRTWFLARWPYRLFMLRELSAVFIAAYVVVLLLLVSHVHSGRQAFKGFQATLDSPALLAFNSIVLVFALLHSATWFQAVPKALPLRRGAEKVPPQLLIGTHYLAMLAVSAIMLIVALS
ncbi:MAG: fumarate reductase subunit C [Acidobacteriota bacterium]|nr:fumarate reductase subunit C [Acidobacteriota bacterium]